MVSPRPRLDPNPTLHLAPRQSWECLTTCQTASPWQALHKLFPVIPPSEAFTLPYVKPCGGYAVVGGGPKEEEGILRRLKVNFLPGDNHGTILQGILGFVVASLGIYIPDSGFIAASHQSVVVRAETPCSVCPPFHPTAFSSADSAVSLPTTPSAES